MSGDRISERAIKQLRLPNSAGWCFYGLLPETAGCQFGIHRGGHKTPNLKEFKDTILKTLLLRKGLHRQMATNGSWNFGNLITCHQLVARDPKNPCIASVFNLTLKVRCFAEMELCFPRMPGYPAFAIASGSGHISPRIPRPIDPRSRENLGIGWWFSASKSWSNQDRLTAIVRENASSSKIAMI